MRREFLIGTTLVALVAATVTGVIADKIIEDLENHFSAGGLWKQVAFMVLVPAAFGALTLVLPGRRDEWMPVVFVAAAAALAMAYAVGREFANGLDQNDAAKIAGRAWYGVMYFGAGMLIPLAVTVGRLARRADGDSAPSSDGSQRPGPARQP
jgi:hypothetical protein